MLDHLRRRVVELLAPTHTATLSTYGPAGIQAQILPCEARDLLLYLFVPATSDQLFNLEHHSTVVVTTADWQLHGVGRVLRSDETPPDITLLHAYRPDSHGVVEIRPSRVQVGRPDNSGFCETIDIDETVQAE